MLLSLRNVTLSLSMGWKLVLKSLWACRRVLWSKNLDSIQKMLRQAQHDNRVPKVTLSLSKSARELQLGFDKLPWGFDKHSLISRFLIFSLLEMSLWACRRVLTSTNLPAFNKKGFVKLPWGFDRLSLTTESPKSPWACRRVYLIV